MTDPDATSFHDRSVASGTTYTYRVDAVHHANDESASSNEASVTVP